jgi:hypothetical protein
MKFEEWKAWLLTATDEELDRAYSSASLIDWYKATLISEERYRRSQERLR